MNPQSKGNVKDFFLNLGATVALYTVVGSLVNLLFTIINKAYPKIVNGYDYYGSSSISWPVAILVIFFPIFILLMWLIGKDYANDPVRKNSGIHKWLTYITLFLAGLAMAIDLIMVLYYFIDGQELTTGFLLKILALLVIAGGVFTYYTSDIRGKLTPKSRNMWRVVAGVVVIGSIVWGFVVLGSPRTQRLYKYDDAKVSELQNINNAIQNYYSINSVLPKTLVDLDPLNYGISGLDSQTQKPYEYTVKTKNTYELCAEFNKASLNSDGNTRPVGYTTWNHPAGKYCFPQTINPNMYPGVKLPM